MESNAASLGKNSNPAQTWEAHPTSGLPLEAKMRQTLRWGQLFKETFSDFLTDKGQRLGASLAFYTTFSVAPILVLSVALGSLFFGAEAVQGHLKHELTGLLGKDGAEGIQTMISHAGQEQHVGIISSILGIAVLLFGATGVFVELKDAMNTIWGVETRPELGFWGLVRDRILSFAMVLSIAFLLLISMVFSAVVTAFAHWIPVPTYVAQVSDVGISLILITFLFMLIFKYLPDASVQWRDVWIGAIATGVLFTIGKYLIGLYLGNAAIGSAYGAAGSLVIFMIWTYYSAQILFLGAEFTQTYAKLTGRRIAPSRNARPIRGPRGEEE